MPGDTEEEDIMPVHDTRMIRDMNDSIKMMQKIVFSQNKYPARPLLPNLADMSDNIVDAEDSPLWWAIDNSLTGRWYSHWQHNLSLHL